ncbi:MAG: ATP-binding protein [Candidatus Auribacterota bacterium]|nr:ATP-binding protein [Candidatus Auribacterota bacterium]
MNHENHPEELKKRPEFELFLAEISAEFINLPCDRVDEKIEAGLRRMVEFMGADRSTLGEFLLDGSEFHVIHSYAVPGIEPIPRARMDHLFPWAKEKIIRGEIISFSNLDELPGEAEPDKQTLLKLKQKSNIIIPIAVGKSIRYALAIGTIRSERVWPEELIPRLRLLGEIFANALARKQAEEKIAASEEAFASIFENAPVAMLLLDRARRVHKINRQAGKIFAITEEPPIGRRFGEAVRCIHHLDDPDGCGFGDFCRNSCAVRRIVEEAYETGRARHQVEAVITSGAGSEERELFFLVSASFVNRPGDRELLVCVEDVTRRREAENRSLELREELFHVTRSSSMGELAAALAHEIKQPLTAILSNARAAARFLSPDNQDLDEVKEALSDIANDSSRADRIILRLREMMRKGRVERVSLDINNIIEDLLTVVHGEADRQGASIRLELGDELPSVPADRIQIQQVILNLVLNSLDAGGREVVVHTMEGDSGTIRVEVRDDGTGIVEDDPDRVFAPYLTTKEGGMGMGLAISRTIINAHGGTIRAENNPGGGATVYFLLPCGNKK